MMTRTTSCTFHAAKISRAIWRLSCPAIRVLLWLPQERACNSASAFSSQNRMSIFAYIVVAVARCSCACSRLPERRVLGLRLLHSLGQEWQSLRETPLQRIRTPHGGDDGEDVEKDAPATAYGESALQHGDGPV